jgi:hypothetical protein
MKLTTVSVRYGRTQSLESYSNVRPEITLSAELEDGDDPEAVRATLLVEARAFVEEAVDQALEQGGQAAKFERGPRYRTFVTAPTWVYLEDVAGRRSRQVKVSPLEYLAIIVPNAATLPQVTNGYIDELYPRKVRLGHAHLIVAEYIHACLGERPGGIRVIHCSDGDLSRIPAWVWEPAQAPPPEAQPAPEPIEPDDDERDPFDGED